MSYIKLMSTRGNPQGNLAPVLDSGISNGERRRQIATFFRERRQASGLSLEQVAMAIGHVEATQLQGYESAIDPIPLDMIFALTNVLNIPPEDVMNLIYDAYNENHDDC